MLDTILGGFFTVCGITGVSESGVDLVRARRSHDWPMVAAEIVDSRVERQSAGHSGGRFLPVVRYRYSVNGVTYEGRRVQFTRLETAAREDAERLTAPFQAGRNVVVRVSPSNPRVSVIQPGQDGRSWLHMLLFAAFAAFGIAMLSGLLV
jgi:hypothetical protein